MISLNKELEDIVFWNSTEGWHFGLIYVTSNSKHYLITNLKVFYNNGNGSLVARYNYG